MITEQETNGPEDENREDRDAHHHRHIEDKQIPAHVQGRLAVEGGPDQHKDKKEERSEENVPQLSRIAAEKIGQDSHNMRVTKIGLTQNLSQNRLLRHKYSVFVNHDKYSARN